MYCNPVRGNFKDLNPIEFGHHQNKPGNAVGPSKYKYAIVHFVKSGYGTLVRGNKKYRIGPGDAFVTVPDERYFWYADNDDPWVYAWINFDGELCRDFAEVDPVISYSSDEHYEKIMAIQRAAYPKQKIARLTAILFDLYSDMVCEPKNDGSNYTKAAKEFIDQNYMYKIGASQIAYSLNIDRTYLFKVFKKNTGMNVRDYIISVRMKNAAHLLESGKNVTEAAFLCGFSSQTNFTKMFSKFFGMTPRNYKKINTEA